MAARQDVVIGWPRNGVVVITAANSWDVKRMADRQLAEALAAHAPVLYVDPPRSAVGRLRSGGVRHALAPGHRLTRVGPNILRLTPEGLPGVSRTGVGRLNGALTAIQVNHVLRRAGATTAATLEAQPASPIMGRVRGRPRQVLWAQDDFVGMAPLIGVDPAVFENAMTGLLPLADAVVAANPVVAQDLRDAGAEIHLIPFGCDASLFESASGVAPASDIEPMDRPAVLMGTVNDRLDMDVLEAVADQDVPLLIVGPRSARYTDPRFDALVARPGVQWVGERPFDSLPAYLSGAGVGLVPYTHSRFNQGSFPLKTLEYLAAGLPVVAVDLPAIRWLDAPDVSVADDPEGFARAVVQLRAGAGDAAAIARRRATARAHTWAARADAFVTVLGLR